MARKTICIATALFIFGLSGRLAWAAEPMSKALSPLSRSEILRFFMIDCTTAFLLAGVAIKRIASTVARPTRSIITGSLRNVLRKTVKPLA